MKDIMETAREAGNFSKLVEAVQAGGYGEMLKSEDEELTVFAPNDSAFDKLPEGAFQKLLEDKDRLQQVLRYHICDGKYLAEDIMNMDEIETLEGEDLDIDTEDGDVMIEDAMIIKPDVECTNGVIHVIDRVLMPEE